MNAIFEKQKYGLGIFVDVNLDVSKLRDKERTIVISKDEKVDINSESGVLDKVSIKVGDNCKVKIREAFESGVRGQLLDLEVGENSMVDYEFNSNGRNFSLRKAFVKKNGIMNWKDNLKGEFNRIVSKTYLEGDNAESSSKMISKGENEDLFDIGNEIIHLGKGSKSKMINKTILDGKSRQIYRGLIKINREVKNCIGSQKSETLLLSEETRTDNIPSLEIDNNEVICSHSVSISKISEDILFYMMSRGLSEEEAKKEYVKGFIDGENEI